MDTLSVKKMILAVCQTEIDNKEELCRLDGFVGDGDHGYTVERGFSAVKSMLETTDFETPGQLFSAVGDTLSEAMGGAIGLILGGMYTGGAKKIIGKAEIGTADCRTFLEDGLNEVKNIGGAKEGDRTLIDALSPAVDAYKTAENKGQSLAECWAQAAFAADKGSKSTANMVAKKGRAKFLQEKSLGYVDAGATTVKLMIEAMSEYIRENVSQIQ